MGFTEATTRLKELGVTQEKIADALGGVSQASVRAARLDPDSPNYRKPPADWKAALVALARAQGGQLLKFADELEGD